jgi:hypothetical protein
MVRSSSPFALAVSVASMFGVGQVWSAPGGERAGRRVEAPRPRAAIVAPQPERPTGPPPPIMPLGDVRPGMVGEAHTVFSGTRPEPFKVRVISVVHNFMPKQDVILMKAEDPRVEFSGIVAGMSGSPVYIDGKLVGAVAYAWSFSKSPIAGVTPIENMLAEARRPRRSTRERLDTGELVTAPGAGRTELSARDPGEAARADERDSLQLPAPSASGARAASEAGSQLRPVMVPLAVTGLSNAALELLAEDLRPYGLSPMRAGGGGGQAVQRLAGSLMPGAAVGVQLIKGDMNATAIGTVTWTNGNQLLAFGHPMFGNGEVSLPLVTGEVHTFIPSQASSMKLASPLVEVGAVVQDRPSCILGDLSMRAPMLPIEVRVKAPGAPARLFQAELARSKRLLPNLAATVLMSAIADAEPDQTEMAVRLTSRLEIKGARPVELRDVIFTTEGLGPRALLGVRGLRALVELLANPFGPVRVERLEFEVDIEFRKDLAEIVSVGLPGEEIRAGETLPLRVTLRPYAGREYTQTVAVKIPERLAGQAVKVDVASGALVRPETPRPESVSDVIENLRAHYTASSIVVSLSLPDDGASLRGRLIPELPAAALDTLRPGNQTRRAEGYRLAERTVVDSPRPVAGRQELTLLVRPDLLGRRK